MMMNDVLNKELVQLKQRLELLQSTFMFFSQTKQKPEFCKELVNQIEHDMRQLVNSTSGLTKPPVDLKVK